MRILFAGSPGIAVPALESVFDLSGSAEGFELAGLLTNPDSPKGRSGTAEPTETGAAAERLSTLAITKGKPPLPILKPEKLDAQAREQAAALKPELLVSFAYGKIFGPKFLALFPLGGINIHPSLLPQYRGPTPIPAAIKNGDHETGISIQRLALEMDSGDILLQERMSLNGRETAASLSGRMAEKAAELLLLALQGLAAGTLRPSPQNHADASYCSLIKKEDGIIDWTRSAAEIDAGIRAFDPWPLSWTMHGDQQLIILKAAPLDGAGIEGSAVPGRVLGIDKEKGILIQTGNGVLAVTELQYRTKKPLEWRAFINGARNFLSSRLG
ncbi:MAG: methionyl-tRNA formyltransferase [Treponema sp.]|jgi:methionyl-tRNA formyltransferase|nr:methionyl-tRNA formyltransferase [Treponema sp.]